MYRGLSVIVLIPVYNEETKIEAVIRRVPEDIIDEIVVIDDGSTDSSAKVARNLGAFVLSMGSCVGVGAALRSGFRYAVGDAYDVAVVMAGNNKDAPEEIPRLLDPIADGRAAFVQGSRFLGHKRDFGEMPFYRRIATRIHPVLFSLVAGQWVTESTNGFRAIHRSVLEDQRIDLDQDWLDQYELEPYLYLRVIQCGYATTEVPVSKKYPSKELGQTKMRPITGWWSILRPLVLVGLRIKR